MFHETSPNARLVQYPLLSDRNGQIAQSYSVLSEKGTAYRASFLIDPNGLIRYYAVYPDEIGREPTEIVRVLKGLQKYEATAELEPAYWQPGMDGIRPDIALAGQI